MASEVAGSRVCPSSHHPASASVLDVSALESIRAFTGGVRILSASIAAYRRAAPKQLAALRVAVVDDNRQSVRHFAHTLKSSSAMLGALGLAAILRQMEQQCDELTADTLGALCAEAETIYQAADAELAAYLTA